MANLIITNNGNPVLEHTTALRLVELERDLKKLKEENDTLKSALLDEMEKQGILKLETPEIAITYVAPTYRESFDGKALQKEMPDIYEEYLKAQPVKSSLRVKIK